MTKNQSHNLSSLLGYPFDAGLLPYLAAESNILIWGADYWSGSQKLGKINIVQAFAPHYSDWQSHGIDVQPEINDEALYKAIFCMLPKQKEASFYQLAMSLTHLEDNGLLLAVAANDAGGKRLEKWMEEFGLTPSSASKSKCRIVWAIKTSVDQNAVKKAISTGARQVQRIEDHDFMTQPGIFGWDKIDKGSKLLISHIPDNLSGYGADFGAGYGYLSNHIGAKCPKVRGLIAAEADYNALECSKENLKCFDIMDYQWVDLTKPLKLNRLLDFIVMNPPFHSGKKADPDIGLKFIENAAQALRKDGILYLVANAHLPYEKHIQHLFSRIEKLDENQGFKVYKAYK